MSDTREESQKPRTEVYRHREIFGLLSMAFGALLFLSLLTYHPSDPSWNVTGSGKTHNAAGPLGAYLSDLFLQLFGVGAYVIVFIALLFAFVMLLQRSVALRWISVLGYLCMGLFASGLLHLWFGVWQPHGYSTGGVWGQWLGTTIASKAGNIGAQILLLMCLLISIIWTTRFSFLNVFEVWWNRLSPSFHQYFLRWHETFLDWRDSVSRWKRKREEKRQRQRLSRMSDHQLAAAGGPDLPALNLDSSWLDQESQWAIGHAEQDTHDPEGHFPDLTPPEQKGVSYSDIIDSWEFDAEGNEVQNAKDAPQHIDAMLNIQSDTPTPIISQRAMNGSLSMPPMEIGDVPLHPEATVDLTLQTQPETQDEEGLELPSPPPPGGMGSKVNPILQRLPAEAKNVKRLDTN